MSVANDSFCLNEFMKSSTAIINVEYSIWYTMGSGIIRAPLHFSMKPPIQLLGYHFLGGCNSDEKKMGNITNL
jgi:hypothetical protein